MSGSARATASPSVVIDTAPDSASGCMSSVTCARRGASSTGLERGLERLPSPCAPRSAVAPSAAAGGAPRAGDRRGTCRAQSTSFFAPASSTSTAATIAASGVRSSCEALARKRRSDASRVRSAVRSDTTIEARATLIGRAQGDALHAQEAPLRRLDLGAYGVPRLPCVAGHRGRGPGTLQSETTFDRHAEQVARGRVDDLDDTGGVERDDPLFEAVQNGRQPATLPLDDRECDRESLAHLVDAHREPPDLVGEAVVHRVVEVAAGDRARRGARAGARVARRGSRPRG